MVYDANENSSLSSIYPKIIRSMSSASSVTMVQKLPTTINLLEIWLPSGSFDYQCRNLNMFLLSPKPSRNIKQLGSKKYGDDTIIMFFDNMEKMYLTSSKNEGKFSKDKKIQYCVMEDIVHTPSPETV